MDTQILEEKKNEAPKWIDTLVPVIVSAGPIMTIPQVYTIWESQNASGVSLIAWVAYAVLSFFWVLYAIAHGDRAVLLHNLLYLIVCLLVVLGVVVFG